jgi:uncharacterized membrane protein YfcA
MVGRVYEAVLSGSAAMHVTAGAFVVAASAVSVGALVQGSVGFGVNLLAAPFVAIVEPAALPATLVLVALPLALAVLRREHHGVAWSALPWMVLGAVPGTLLGLVIVGHVSATELAIVVGGVTILGVALSIASGPIEVTPTAAFTAGFVSNLFGTASSVGGPPVALLFQHHPGPVARSTLGGFFAATAVLSLVGYVVTGHITVAQLVFALELSPFMVGGLLLSRRLHGLVDAGWLRPVVLALSAIAGLIAIGRAVV